MDVVFHPREAVDGGLTTPPVDKEPTQQDKLATLAAMLLGWLIGPAGHPEQVTMLTPSNVGIVLALLALAIAFTRSANHRD